MSFCKLHGNYGPVLKYPTQYPVPCRTLSDVDNDGKLTSDEFCIAMHLLDIVRSGRPLPSKLPAELYPTGAKGQPGAVPPGAPGGVVPAPGGIGPAPGE